MYTADFRAGVRTVSPVLVGLVPFGLVAGITAVDVGFTPLQAVGMSLVVFAGAAQLAAIDLIGRDAPLAVAVLTAGVVNLRHVMYSASLAPYFRDRPLRLKALLSYVLTDQAYAFPIAEFTGDDDRHRLSYYFGVALPAWAVWQASTVAGVVLGQGIPDEWGFSFALPLVFIALLVPAVSDAPALAAALLSGTVAVVADLPFELGLVAAAVSGIVVGLAVEEVRA